jgi:hypothetical protein
VYAVNVIDLRKGTTPASAQIEKHIRKMKLIFFILALDIVTCSLHRLASEILCACHMVSLGE